MPLLSSGLVAVAGLASAFKKSEKKEPKVSLSPTTGVYGDQVIAFASAPKIITVSNVGNADLVISNAFVS